MGKHIDALTGVRAVAVLLVFLGHLQQRFFPYAWLDGSALSVAPYYAMTTFFVLSGFVIHWNYGELFTKERPAAAWWKFFVARFARLWPLHFAVSVLAFMQSRDFGRFAQHVFMVQTWVYEGSYNIAYYNTWSVSTEWFFYFCYAATFPLIARWLRPGSIWLLAAIVTAAFAAYWFAGPVMGEPDLWVRYVAPYLRLLEFSTGVVAAQIVMTRRAQGNNSLSDVILALVIALTVMLYHTALCQRTNINYLVAPIVAVALIVSSDRRSLTSSALSASWLLWIGDRSYSIYLLEAVYLVALGYDFETHRTFTWSDFVVGMACASFGLALVLFLSHFCWRYFEMPARTVIKQALSGGLNSLAPSRTT
jgi:peptidoglycan/LPS O-acetylase OafA/YrhL